MSAIKWPNGFNKEQKHLSPIVTKHNDLGTKSPLTAFLIQNNIDLNDLTTKATEAVTHDGLRVEYEGKAKQFYEQRDNLFIPIFSTSKKMYQSLKTFYGDNLVAYIQDWGVEITKNGRFLYPSDFPSQIKIVSTLLTKHNSYKDLDQPSPLAPFIKENNVNVNEIASQMDQASKANAEALHWLKLAHNETALRNECWDPVYEIVKKIGNYLISLYPNNPTEVGLWGIPVVLNPTAKSSRVSTVPPGEKVIKKALKIGYILQNTGNADLQIQSGGKKKSAVKIVKPGDEMLIAKGFSRLLVENKDPLEKGFFKVYKK